MGYTKREIISGAFEEIGLGSYTFDLDPEYFQSALRRLDSMMSMWVARGIRIGYNGADTPSDSSLDAQSGLPSKAIEAAILNLAILIAPSFGKAVSMETKQAASTALNALMMAIAAPRRITYPPTLPKGAGSKSSYRRFFEPAEENLELENDNTLDF